MRKKNNDTDLNDPIVQELLRLTWGYIMPDIASSDDMDRILRINAFIAEHFPSNQIGKVPMAQVSAMMREKGFKL